MVGKRGRAVSGSEAASSKKIQLENPTDEDNHEDIVSSKKITKVKQKASRKKPQNEAKASRKSKIDATKNEEGEKCTDVAQETSNVKIIVTPVSPSKNMDKDYLSLLPDEIIITIFKFLSNYVVAKYCSPVCRRWRKLSTIDVLWEELNLAGLTIKFEDLIKLIGRGVKTLYLNNATITGSSYVLSKEDKSKCQLKVLDLDYTSISKDKVKELLKTCFHLESLSLEYHLCAFDKDTYTYIAQNKNLQNLNLTGSQKLVSSGLLQAMKNCESIKYLNLSDTKLSGNIASNTPSSIKILFLNGLTKLSDKELKDIIDRCPHIEELYISRCTGLTKAVNQYVLDGLKNIKKLNINYNNFDGAKNLKELCTPYPSPKYLS